MKYLRQFAIILLISLAGELLSYLLPLPIPASIYGIVILFAGILWPMTFPWFSKQKPLKNKEEE